MNFHFQNFETYNKFPRVSVSDSISTEMANQQRQQEREREKVRCRQIGCLPFNKSAAPV